MFSDRVGLVVVFPPGAWAVLTLPKVERLLQGDPFYVYAVN